MSVMGLSGKISVARVLGCLAPLWVFLSACTGLLCFSPQADALDDPKGVTNVLPDAEIRLECDRFGVGETSRRGEWAGIRLVLTDTSAKPREVLVRITGIDADGDRPVEQREVTLNPGVAQSVWMYVHLPFTYVPGEGLVASVSEALDGGVAPDGGRGYRPGNLLARATLAPNGNSVMNPTQGLIGIVGQRALGMQPYNALSINPNFGQNETWHPYTHENQQLVIGLSGEDMPDRWMGLVQFDVIVWGKGEPGELRGDKAQAVREWIERGGHLVIVLPSVGQNWTNEKVNDLFDVMPKVGVGQIENADLSAYRPLLIGTPKAQYPKTGNVHTFRVLPDAGVAEATPILNGPDGKCVVVRRAVGAGAVTLVGIDLNSTAFSQSDAIDADVFWNRVLGRRGWLERPASAMPRGAVVSRVAWFLDRGVGELISQSGRTALGLLVAFVVFGLYWAIAGPLGFFGLKAKGWQRHAWVGFLGAGGVFTAIAWGGATVLRPHRVEARHFTIIDHVYGEGRERARMFASVLIPTYGESRIGLTDDGGSAAITPWEPPIDEAGWAGFPDARDYLIDTRAPSSLNVPTRATVKQVQLDWSGGPLWNMPVPQGVAGTPGVLTLDPTGGGSSGRPLVSGILVHKLPGTLTKVRVVVVRGQTTLKPVRSKRTDIDNYPQVQGEAFDVSQWAPNTPLDLAVTTAPLARADSRNLVPWLNALTPGTMGIGLSQQENTDYVHSFEDRMWALTFMGYLKPMDTPSDTLANLPAAQRTCLHGYDLSRWLTQPCVIIMGFLGDEAADAPSPVPLAVDGKAVKTLGRTFVRWVYPLPANPPAYPSETELQPGTPDEQRPEGAPDSPQDGADAPQGGTTDPQ